MVRVAVGFLLVCALVTFINTARADGPFRETLTLRTGQLLVVEESALEPRGESSQGPTREACEDVGEMRLEWSTYPVEETHMSYGQ